MAYPKVVTAYLIDTYKYIHLMEKIKTGIDLKCIVLRANYMKNISKIKGKFLNCVKKNRVIIQKRKLLPLQLLLKFSAM